MIAAIIAEAAPHIRAQLSSLLAELWPALLINVVAPANDGVAALAGVAPANDGVAALAAIRAHGPDVLFLDVKTPGLSGVEALQAVGLRLRAISRTTFRRSESVEATIGRVPN